MCGKTAEPAGIVTSRWPDGAVVYPLPSNHGTESDRSRLKVGGSLWVPLATSVNQIEYPNRSPPGQEIDHDTTPRQAPPRGSGTGEKSTGGRGGTVASTRTDGEGLR